MTQQSREWMGRKELGEEHVGVLELSGPVQRPTGLLPGDGRALIPDGIVFGECTHLQEQDLERTGAGDPFRSLSSPFAEVRTLFSSLAKDRARVTI